MALGKLHSLKTPPEEGNGKPFLSILYLENPGKFTIGWNQLGDMFILLLEVGYMYTNMNIPAQLELMKVRPLGLYRPLTRPVAVSLILPITPGAPLSS